MDTAQQRTLLLVDDEENILRSLRRLFRREGYQILTALSGAEGLELLGQHAVGVIVSDQRMPEMTGSEFLQRVKERYPETVRIILSGYTDLESVTESINIGAVYKFLTKPWEDDLLVRNVNEAFRIYELNEENQRLTTELQLANQELERRVEEKTRALQFNLQALRISQDILEELPIAVLGIDAGQAIVINRRAREVLQGMPLIPGSTVDEIFPPPLQQFYHSATNGGGGETTLDINGHTYRCECQPNRSEGPHQGYILTLRE